MESGSWKAFSISARSVTKTQWRTGISSGPAPGGPGPRDDDTPPGTDIAKKDASPARISPARGSVCLLDDLAGLGLLRDDRGGLGRGPGGLLDHHEAAGGAGDGALDEDEVLVLLDLNDVEVSAGDLLDAPVAGHALSGVNALGDGVLAAEGAGGALAVGLAVRGGEAVEAPAADDAHEASALGGADDVDLLVGLEDADVKLGADLDLFL